MPLGVIDEKLLLYEFGSMQISPGRDRELLQDLPEQTLTALMEKNLSAQGVKLSVRALALRPDQPERTR